MPRIALFCIVILGALLAAAAAVPPAAAFDSPAVAAAAADYAARLRNADGDRSETVAALSDRARAANEAGDPAAAVAAYEALIGRGQRDGKTWLALAEAWSRRDPAAASGTAAAWNAYAAYRAAPGTGLAAQERGPGMARALIVLGGFLEARERWLPALDAYNEAIPLLPQPDPALVARRDTLQQTYAFRITQVHVANEQEAPQVCLDFSMELAEPRRTNYADFLRIDPLVPVEIQASERSLCLSGVRFGEHYTVTALAGLPSKAGQRLRADDKFQVTINDRNPSVSFRGNAYILPRSGERTVPLSTVNVDKVRLRLLRINDRNLVGEVVSQRVGVALGTWEINEIAETRGEPVWRGEMPVEVERNRDVVTAVPVAEILPSPAPGVYILTASNAAQDDEYQIQAAQWLIVTDLGLVAFTGGEGPVVAARSLGDGGPLAGVRVDLLARNNSVLGGAVTDADGIARFDPGLGRGQGGNRPAAALAYTEAGDFAFLELTGPAFDLSDRGVGGRAAPGPLDTYIYAERGVYRPGETVELVALLRNGAARAVEGMPFTLLVRRPDGMEAQRSVITDSGAGGHRLTVPLAPSARTGTWTVEAYVDPAAPPVGRTSFQVEDFVPLRLRVELSAADAALRPGAPTSVTVSAQYLYGAPAVGLPGDGELLLRPAAAPWPDWAGYRFGLEQETFSLQRVPVEVPPTDRQGRTVLSVALDGLPDTSLPLEGVLRASVFDTGGRPVNGELVLPIRPDQPWIGIKPQFYAGVEANAEAGFDIVMLDRDGRRRAADGLRYELYSEHYDYQWFYVNGTWDYRVIARDRMTADGTLAVAADAPAVLTQRVGSGRYRLEVFDPASGAASSVRFTAGWWVPPTVSDSPDKLEVTLDHARYRAGETAQVHIKPPFAGQVLLTVANDKVLETRNLTVPAEGLTVELPVKAEWGVGAYVLATAFRPAETGAARGPGRAVSLSWLALDKSDDTLAIRIETPDAMEPRRTLEVPVTVANAKAGEPVFLTLAAVDEGILLLTNHHSPDPAGFYYGKRALGLDMRDAYGRLIVSQGRRGAIRSGGSDDGGQLTGPPERMARIVSLFSGIVPLDDRGRATVRFEIPDFNGSLRLMAVAWSASAVGAAERPLTVRDPVIAELSLPRFLAPDDVADLSLGLHNLAGPPGTYTAALAVEGPARLQGSGRIEAALEADGRRTERLRLQAEGIGTAHLTLTLGGPNGFAVTRNWSLPVRPAQTWVTDRTAGLVRPGESVPLGSRLTAGYLPGTAEVSVSFSTRPNLDIPGLVRALDGYPYGCTEQTVSQALPLLYLGEVASGWGEAWRPADIRRRVQAAVDRVMTLQGRDGSFGLWSARDGGEPWLTAYAMDFLTRAREEGYHVPQAPWREGLTWLSTYTKSWQAREQCPAASAYGLYVTARAGTADVSALRYFSEICGGRLPSPMAQAQLGAALARYGDMTRAAEAFTRAAQPREPGTGAAGPDSRDYGSALRDRAAVAALMSEAQRPVDQVLAIADEAATQFRDARRTSTQEDAWLLLAAAALVDKQEPMALEVDGRAVPETTRAVEILPDAAILAHGITVRNLGRDPVRQVVSIRGVPAEDRPAESNGLTLTRGFYDIDGEPIDPETDGVTQNDLIVVLLEGEATTGLNHQALIVDLLPAGFEIENPRIGQGRGLDHLVDRLALTAPSHVERRDDRFVAAQDLDSGNRRFAVAYLVRAVTPGRFVLPGAFVEDMYKPEYHASTTAAEITVEPRE